MSSILEMLSHAGLVGISVMALLVLFSLTSWTIIFAKWFYLRNIHKENLKFIDIFWQTKDLGDLINHPLKEKSPSARMFKEGVYEFERQRQKGKERPEIFLVLERSLARLGRKEIGKAESQVSMLATIGSISPFIGLFGTVIGIMSSFEEIGLKGNASLATVAPGIAESLLATALGLFASIPAVMAYNFFQGRIRSLRSDLEHFGLDLLAVLKAQK